jgi:hypothetical protein
MYSPKIREDLIPKVYRAAKGAKVAMTKWVNRVIEEALPEDAELKDQETNEKDLRKEKRQYERFRT